jgi:hypothetical protein
MLLATVFNPDDRGYEIVLDFSRLGLDAGSPAEGGTDDNTRKILS